MEEIVAQRVKVKQVSIYALVDPDAGDVRYIGKSVNVERRYKEHLKLKGRNARLNSWIKSVISNGGVPELRILTVCDEPEWEEAERSAIADARNRGLRLFNIADGGGAPYCPAHIRVQNGKKNARARVNTPFKAYVWKLKHRVGLLLKEGKVSEANKEKLRYAARKRPDLFGKYASI